MDTSPSSEAHPALVSPVDHVHSLAKLSWSIISTALGSSGSSVTEFQVIDDSGTMWPQQLAERTPLNQNIVLDQYPTLIFLGADESRVVGTALPVKPSKGLDQRLEDHTSGDPVWAIDVTDVHTLADETKVFQLWKQEQDAPCSIDRQGFKFIDLRTALLNASDASLAAQSRSLIDWNTRNRFCSACGRPTHSEWVGWKLACTSDVQRADDPTRDVLDTGSRRPACLTQKGGVQNFW